MTEAVEAVIEECRPGLAGKLAKQAVDVFQVFEDHLLFFRRRLFGFGNQHQLGEVGLFQRGATEIIEQQALGDRHQECPRLARCLQFFTAQQAHESVLAQVFGPLRAGDVASKPGQ
ncbi:hypothetical protein D9M69_640620 [compost metagenome]